MNGGGTTYDKEQLLGIYKSQESAGTLNRKLEELVLLSDFANGSTGRGGAGWGRSGDEPMSGAEMCWDKDGMQKPVSLEEPTEDEREVCRQPNALPTCLAYCVGVRVLI